MAGPLKRTSTTQTSGGLGSNRSDFDNNAKYYYNCGYEAVMYETDDNYNYRYLVCPLEVNCNSFIVDPSFSNLLLSSTTPPSLYSPVLFMSLHRRPHLE